MATIQLYGHKETFGIIVIGRLHLSIKRCKMDPELSLAVTLAQSTGGTCTRYGEEDSGKL